MEPINDTGRIWMQQLQLEHNPIPVMKGCKLLSFVNAQI